MKKKNHVAEIIVAVVVAVILIVAVFARIVVKTLFNTAGSSSKESAEWVLTGGNMSITLPTEPYVGIVSVYGTIEPQTRTGTFDQPQNYQHLALMDYIDAMMYDPNNSGILLDVDSPGGTTYEGVELYDKIVEYRDTTGRPVWTYMNHYGASAAYYIAAPSDRIGANKSTMTGSIGVIMSGYDLSGLYEKLGIKYYSVTTGDNKDMSSPNEEQLEIYQDIIAEEYDRFVGAVAEGRGMPDKAVRELADGRPYSAQQAVDNGLIDEITTFEDLAVEMQYEVGNTTFYQPDIIEPPLASLFGKAEEILPKSDMQVLSELTEKYGSGVLMSCAGQTVPD